MTNNDYVFWKASCLFDFFCFYFLFFFKRWDDMIRKSSRIEVFSDSTQSDWNG